MPICRLILLALLVVVAGPAAAQSPLSSQLSSRFATLAKACFGTSSETFLELFVPEFVTTHPTSAETKYLHIPRVSFGALSTFVFSGDNLVEAASGPGSRFLKGVEITPQDVTGSAFFSALTYSFSCTSALRVAMNAGLDPSPINPFSKRLDLEAGLSAEANGKEQTGLVVLYGRFESPLAAMLIDSDPAKRMKAVSAVWSHLSGPGPHAKSPTYLDFFEGWLVSSTTSRDASKTLNSSTEANIHALVLDANWSSQAKLTFTDSFRNQSFDIYILPRDQRASRDKYPNEYNYNLYALPGVTRISSDIAAASSVNPAFAEVFPNRPAEYRVVIPDLNAALCGIQGHWSGSTAAPNSIVSVVPTFDTTSKSCVITVQATVRPSQSFVPIRIEITNTQHTVSGQTVSFSKEASYRDAAYPTARFTFLPSIDYRVDDRAKIRIDAPIEIETPPNVLVTDVRVKSASLNCGENRKADAFQRSYVPQSPPSVTSLFAFEDVARAPAGTCIWTVDLSFNYGGTPFDRSISHTVNIAAPQAASAERAALQQ